MSAPPARFAVAAVSLQGARAVNADAARWRDVGGRMAVAVADGVGPAAETARFCAERFCDAAAQAQPPRAALSAINAELVAGPLEKSACAMSAGVFEGARFEGAHVGDTRIAMIRGGALSWLTRDQTLREMTDDGAPRRGPPPSGGAASTLINAIGLRGRLRLAQVVHADCAIGDRFVFSTDGAHRVIGDKRLPAVARLVARGAPDVAATIARRFAIHDNATLVTVDVLAA